MSDSAGKIGVLYVVATPIGNLDDISGRAVSVLSDVDRILAEDTRHTRKLMQRYDIRVPVVACHDHNERSLVDSQVSDLKGGLDMALVSDAGTPLINDPGFLLVRAAQEAGVRVSPIPGPCSIVTALSVAGLPAERFCYEGFLPSRRSARVARLEQLASETRTMIMLETSHRIVASLEDLCSIFGEDREAVIARELTKRFETISRGTLGELRKHVTTNENQRKGEFVVLVAGSTDTGYPEEEVERVLSLLLERLPVREATEVAAEILGYRKNRLYKLALELQSDGSDSGA